MSLLAEVATNARALTLLPVAKQGLSAIPINQGPLVVPQMGNVPQQWSMEWLGPGRPILPPWTMFRPGSIRGGAADLEWNEPRTYQYTPNVNATITPRAAYGLTPFSQLLFYSDNVPEAALARRLTIEELKNLTPQIRDGAGNLVDVHNDLPELEWMIKMPDRFTAWSTWLSRLWRNILTYDAAALWRIRDENDKTFGMRVLDGSTLFVVIDPRGEQPHYPAPAFQQVIWGVPRGWYTTEDIWYRPRMPQLNAPYGTAPIEDAWLPGQWLYNFWVFEVAAYTTGTIPDSIITAPQNWTPDQIFTFEDTFNSRQAGNAEERAARIRMFPNGSTQISTKDVKWNNDGYRTAFERILQSYGIPPSEVGQYTAGMLGGKGVKDKSETTLYRQIFGPAISFTETAFNEVLIDDYGFTDLKWELGFEPESADPEKEEERTLNRWTSSLYTRDHTLEELGQDPAGGDVGAEYYPVKSMAAGAAAGQADALQQAGIGVRPKQFTINQQVPVKDGSTIEINSGNGAIPIRGKVKVIKRKADGTVTKAVQDIPNLRHIAKGETQMCGNCQFHRDFTGVVYCWKYDSKVQEDWMCDSYEPQAEHPDALTVSEQLGKQALLKHCGVCDDDDSYFGAPVSREIPIDLPKQGANAEEIVSIAFSGQDPRPAIWKPADGEKSELVSAIGGPQYVREEAAWLLDRELNEPDNFLVPVAYVTEVDEQEGAALHYVTGREAAQSVSEYAPEWVERAGVLDYIAGQTDRHGGNWLTHPDDDGRPILIDNGMAFPVTSRPINSPFVDALRDRVLSSEMLLSLKQVVGNKALWQDIKGLVGKEAASTAWERASQLLQDGVIATHA